MSWWKDLQTWWQRRSFAQAPPTVTSPVTPQVTTIDYPEVKPNHDRSSTGGDDGFVHQPVTRSLWAAHPQGVHRLVYADWGEAKQDDVVLCLHGLTRNRHDFDRLADALADHWRVICLDVVGRGDSDWLGKAEHYHFVQYCADVVALLARIDAPRIHLLGTSMGGLIGLFLAATPAIGGGRPLLASLIMNDVGPLVSGASVRRIAQYVSQRSRWPDLAAAEAELRQNYAGFGNLSDAEWAYLCRHSVKKENDAWVPNYDPAIAEPFKHAFAAQDSVFWPEYDRIDIPVLVLRGENSEVLTSEVQQEMAQRGPKAKTATFAGVGHAPALLDGQQIAVVRSFLAGLG